MQVRISELRKSLGMQQKDLAERAGISSGYLSQIESGSRRLNVEVQIKIANALGVKPSALVDFDATDHEDMQRVKHAMERATAAERRLMLQIAEMVEERLFQEQPQTDDAPPEAAGR